MVVLGGLVRERAADAVDPDGQNEIEGRHQVHEDRFRVVFGGEFDSEGDGVGGQGRAVGGDEDHLVPFGGCDVTSEGRHVGLPPCTGGRRWMPLRGCSRAGVR
jgi:hypothetical protein